jgi:hypothetical protein
MGERDRESTPCIDLFIWATQERQAFDSYGGASIGQRIALHLIEEVRAQFLDCHLDRRF